MNTNKNNISFKELFKTDEAKKFLNHHNIKNYTLDFKDRKNSFVLADVNGDVILSGKNLTNADIKVKFRNVTGDFNCSNNKLTSLDFAPDFVGGDFDCSRNQLTSLKCCPKEVGKNFNCSNNLLTTLNFSPKKIQGYFNCSNNKLISLNACPKKVSEDLNCSNNQLTSLQGIKNIGGDFDCSNNKLASLEHTPTHIIGDFNCSNCDLTSLDFAPEYVGGNFDCSNNKLTSLDNASNFVGGNFNCSHNDLKSVGKNLCIVGDFYCYDNRDLSLLKLKLSTKKPEEGVIYSYLNLVSSKFEEIENIYVKGNIYRDQPEKPTPNHEKLDDNDASHRKTCQNKAILTKMIELNFVPRYLYKYCPLDENHKKYTERTITDNEVYFNNPINFNDPYDCNIPIAKNAKEKEITGFAESMGLNKNKYIIEFLKNPKTLSLIEKTARKKINDIGITCFSSLYDSILMWSHYADFHKGICLKFDILEDPDFFLTPLIVKYTQIQPGFSIFYRDDDEIKKVAQRKYTDWSYESEVRILKSKEDIQNNKQTNPRIFTFNNKALKEIIFGTKTDSATIAHIQELCKQSSKNDMIFSQMELEERNYDTKKNESKHGKKDYEPGIHFGMKKLPLKQRKVKP